MFAGDDELTKEQVKVCGPVGNLMQQLQSSRYYKPIFIDCSGVARQMLLWEPEVFLCNDDGSRPGGVQNCLKE